MYETWKAVPGYEGSYEVSDQGNVRSLDRTDSRGRKWKGIPRKPYETDNKYMGVFLSNGHSTHYLVHRLVAAAFLGPRPEGLEVNHKDGNKHNNRPENLEYVTPSENKKHAFDNGISIPKRGEENARSILTEKQVREIKHLLAEGELTLCKIGARYGVSRYTIYNISAGRRWKHIE
jgi:hypothetical protein